MEMENCNPVASFIEGTCLTTPREIASFYLGLISIAFWCVCQLPQLYKNYQQKSGKAVSFGLVIQWILGDTCNFIGTVLTRQLPFQKASSVLFVSLDLMMFSQKITYDTNFCSYLSCRKKSSNSNRVHSLRGNNSPLSSRVLVAIAFLVAIVIDSPSLSEAFVYSSTENERWNNVEEDDEMIFYTSKRMFFGSIVGWIATGFYLGSRLAQIWFMLKKRTPSSTSHTSSPSVTTTASSTSTSLQVPLMHETTSSLHDGEDEEHELEEEEDFLEEHEEKEEKPSILMFIFALFGNAFYGSALVTRSTTNKALLKALPWLVGSFGVMFLDGFILMLML